MKKFYFFLLLGIFCLVGKTNAQIGGNTCSTAYAVTGTSFGSSNTTGTPNTDLSNDYGCITPANNASWWYFQACASGTWSAQLTSFISTASDVDFIVWGPLSAPTDCGLTTGQILDCSAATGATDTMSFPVISGSFYKILIANPSNGSGAWTVTAFPSSPLFSDSCYACMTITTPPQEICQVTTDPIANRNVIIWEKDTTYTGDWAIQRETTTMGVYATIATIVNSDTSAYMDTISNPMIQAFSYRIATNDSCGNLNTSGSPHYTIHLLTSISSSTGYPQLSWSSYVGFGYGTYFIYRGASPSTLTLYDSISASFNSYTDVAAVPGMNYYSIAVMPPTPCQPSHTMTKPSMSNTAPVMFTGIADFEFGNLTVGPNPASDAVEFTLGSAENITVELLDITGRMVISQKYENVNSGIFVLNEIENGSYILNFSGEKGRCSKKIVVAK